MPLALYDTLHRTKVPFEPREAGRASMYLCGPTVQAEPHVGHGRGQVVFDVLRRYLAWSGFAVTFVTNITDVDDKIILRANRERSTPPAVAERYARVWNRAMDRLGILPPDVQPRATGHILEMQGLIERLIEDGKAYESGGNVLFRVRSFDGYGKLSGRQVDDMQTGDDIVGADVKEDPHDFAMWKAAKADEPAWPSPWGPGRPGWHIECSAMATAHLGGDFDIHGGGLDLVFPHHENEIAQYEAASEVPFARYWIHHGMVQLGTEKMSKSLGNIVGLGEALDRWGRGPTRLWYLSAQHRSPLVFEDERLDEAVAAFDRLATFRRTALLVAADVEPDPAAADDHAAEFRAAMDDDLNAPRAVAALHELVTAGYDHLGKAEAGDEAAAASVRGLADTLVDLTDEVLGLGLDATVAASRDAGARIAPVVEHLLDERRKAREQRDFAAADAIRDQLTQVGVVVEDRPGGTRWYVDPVRAATGR